MLELLKKETGITVCMLVGMGLSMFLRILLGILYQNMIRESDNMAVTRNKQLKQCKLKFGNCYELGGGVSNVSVFVDRFMGRLTMGPLSFSMMYHLSGQLMLLSVVFAGIGVCRSIMKGRTLGEILPFYIVSFLGLYLYFSVSAVVDVKGKRRTLKTNLVDYLENHLSPRIGVTRQDMEMLYGEAAYKEAAYAEDKVPKGLRAGSRRRLGAAEDRKKKTVELMPISTRTAAGESRGMSAAVCGREREELSAAACGRKREELSAAACGREREELSAAACGREREELSAAACGREREASAMAALERMPGESTVCSAAESRVTAEELEALLKELLAT